MAIVLIQVNPEVVNITKPKRDFHAATHVLPEGPLDYTMRSANEYLSTVRKCRTHPDSHPAGSSIIIGPIKIMSIARRILTLAMVTMATRTLADVPADVPSNRVVVGYFPEWAIYARNYHVTNIPAHLLTHVNYAFLRPVYSATNDTARIEIVDSFAAVDKSYPGDSDSLPFRGSFHQLLKLKTENPDLKTLLSVGGATMSDDFSDIAASAHARGTFAESCLAHMIRYGFDGIDIDWEYPVQGGENSVRHRPEDAANLVLLLRSLRERLDARERADGRHYLLTIAASVTGNTLTKRYQLPQTSKDIDWINLMAYNLIGAWAPATGHQAPLHANPRAPYPDYNVADSISLYLRLKVPRDKLVVGVSFYGRGFKGVPPTDNGLFQKHSGLATEGTWGGGVFTYRDLRDGSQGHRYINADGFKEFWDPVSEASFLYNNQERIFITYPSPRSLRLKSRYVREQNLRGMMCWSLDFDTADHALLRSINDGLRTASVPPQDHADGASLEKTGRHR